MPTNNPWKIAAGSPLRLQSLALSMAVLASSYACSSSSPEGAAPVRGTDDVDGGSSGAGGSTAGGTAGSSSSTGGGGSAGMAGTGGLDSEAGTSGGTAGTSSSDPTAGTGGTGSTPQPVITPTPADAELATASGCAGVFNPDQLLTLALDVDAGDWNQLLADTTYAVVIPAAMQCGDEAPLTVGVRRKRSGGQYKVGLKIDINAIVPEQKWYGLKKLSLENGVSEGDTSDGAEVRTYVAEYLAWRMMVLSGAITSRASLVNVVVNGEPIGVYVNVEQVDKRFLQERLGDDSGWLYKKSGGVDDGLKTHETTGDADNVYDDYFCFWRSGNSCAVPSSAALQSELSSHLDIAQFLRFGAVNAYIANTDGPLFKDNNYYYYDYATGPRVYLPWDLDTAMKDNPSVYSGGGGGSASSFDTVLFTNWRDDYTAILQDLRATKLTQGVIEAELDRVADIATDAFDADPYVTGTTSEAIESLQQYWLSRLATIDAELP